MFNIKINDEKVRVFFIRLNKETTCNIIDGDNKYSATVKCYAKDHFNKHKGMVIAMEKAIRKGNYEKNDRRLFYDRFFSIVSTKKLKK